ncbi:hypothetical protein BGZ65_009744 [Modicella reniformis]|uniref:Uncharacterized protein n=1 Tax=Modicella reniformis TaxID=1440133 RepID=A0A9P6IHX1_9FUNG|nr:hypothetical protein BGZ65_009744 [Modicella reniformis]
MTFITPTSLSVLEQHTWVSPTAPTIELDEYVFILSSLQPHADMARLCRMAQQFQQMNPSSNSIILALSCRNQHELRRACYEWKAIVVHVDPECKPLQRAVSTHYSQYHTWATVRAIIWGGALTAVGWRQNSIVNGIVRNNRWPTSRLASACVALLGFLFTITCATKTFEFIKAIPHGYDAVMVRNKDAGTDHMFLVRRDFKMKSDLQVVPMYLLSGLGLSTILLGARIVYKIKKS